MSVPLRRLPVGMQRGDNARYRVPRTGTCVLAERWAPATGGIAQSIDFLADQTEELRQWTEGFRV